ncbi:MAG: PDZ domain-containing protein, partial [Planctomycetota bacterium]
RGFKLVREKKRRGPFTYEEQKIDRSLADTIIGVAGQNVRSADDLLSLVESNRPGDTIELTILRDGREVVVPVTLVAAE